MKREEILSRLQQQSRYDLLVVGGGASGCGVALDAASRGLKVALVEKNDFAEGTSGRSTKLIHGGVRYLEKAIKRLDRRQYNLVRDGLRERALLLQNARHLSNRLTLVTPIYNWLEVPYVFAGLKLYDLLSGKHHIGHSRLLSRTETLRRFPMLKAHGLKAGVRYHDGQFHDARMALAIALTAQQQGATIINHMALTGLVKSAGAINGATLTDQLTGDTLSLNCTGVINAGGPFVDDIRRLDDPQGSPLLTTSSGVHIVLDQRFAPPDTGLMIPETEDGRVLFILPWEGHALIGTTDEPATLSEHPRPLDTEIDYLLRHARSYFDLQIEPSDIKATWSGLRPLVANPTAVDTAALARDHILQTSPSGLVTLAGGKWTTYRKMAQDTVDYAINYFSLDPAIKGCQTAHLPLIGSSDFELLGGTELVERFALNEATASYLNRCYGDQADQLLEVGRSTDTLRPLVAGHPFLEAEVIYAVRFELAQRVIDILARRTHLAMVDTRAARQATPRILELMAAELGWDLKRCDEEAERTNRRLNEGI
ncbi:glycerol-3-phosphate dehydrogenase/oxidase [Pelovirga terrestris]|uniref:Glycerol-3-phosphate dehydrogenase n=1 Tax=Pelovirga terrestris TaxID=2771352 RepID=A0A8J6QZ64_9BACT|nr:FAD-dependent oxidoreductase [Pelovirga terrestris]MBD1401067.1 FAD-dependent oxidoreductase [Pelovirga terrestris]